MKSSLNFPSQCHEPEGIILYWIQLGNKRVLRSSMKEYQYCYSSFWSTIIPPKTIWWHLWCFLFGNIFEKWNENDDSCQKDRDLPRSRSLICCPLGAPPYTHVLLIFDERPNANATCWTCWASSRVGARTRAWNLFRGNIQAVRNCETVKITTLKNAGEKFLQRNRSSRYLNKWLIIISLISEIADCRYLAILHLIIRACILQLWLSINYIKHNYGENQNICYAYKIMQESLLRQKRQNQFNKI